MNKYVKKPFQDQRKSFGLHAIPLKLWPTKKTFSIGAFICMSATAMAAIASSENPYQNPRALVASPSQPHASSLSNDVYTLREQLLEKTKELQEYKAGLFRASHPQDQAKIVELNRRIAEHEKAKQELIAKIKEIEEELFNTKKQMDSLTVSSNALTDYIKTQRATVEAEKKEMLATIKAFEETIKEEKKLNSKIIGEMIALKAKMANYEMNMAFADQKHQNDLEDSLQDAAMLKFELADNLRQFDMKEHALLVSTLNYLTMAQDHHERLQNRHQVHKSKLEHSTQKLSTLKLTINELTQENERLQKENERLEGGRDLIDKHFAERHVLAERLMEKEEALLAAMAYHEGSLAEQADEVKSLRDRLSEEEAARQELLSQNQNLQAIHDLEKHLLENATASQSEMMTNTLLSYQIAINDYFSELEQVQNKLAAEEALRLKLQTEHDALTQTHASEKQHLQASLDKYKNNLSDAHNSHSKSTEDLQSIHEHLELESLQSNRLNEDLLLLKAELISSNDSIQQHKEEIEQLNQKLSLQQEARNELLKAQEELLEKHASDQTTFETALSEKEEIIARLEQEKNCLETNLQDKEKVAQTALLSTEDSVKHHLAQIEELNEKLAELQSTHLQLQQIQEELQTKHTIDHETFEHILKEKEDLIARLNQSKESAEQTLHEKEEALSSELRLSEESIKNQIDHIADLTEKLAQLQQLHDELKKNHEELHSKYKTESQSLENVLNDKANAFLQLEQTKNALEAALQEKEEALKLALASSEDSTKQHLEKIAQLDEQLEQEKQARQDLQKQHQELLSKYETESQSLKNVLNDKSNAFSQLEQTKNALETALQEKEEALKLALVSADDSTKQHLEQISQLKEKLTQEQASYEDLQRNRDELHAKLEAETESFERSLKEKEDFIAYLDQTKRAAEIAMQEKETALRSDMLASEESLKHHLEQIVQLNEKLTQEIDARKDLQRNKEELETAYALDKESFVHSLRDKEEQIAQLDQSKQSLQHSLHEKEASLKSAIAALEESERQHNDQLNHLNEKQHETEQQYLSLGNKYTSLTGQLEDKRRELETNNHQLDDLQRANDHLNDSLANAQLEISSIKNQLKHAEQISDKTAEELHSLHLDSSHDISVLKGQLNESLAAIEDLKREMAQLYADYKDKIEKEIELDRSIHALTIVAEHQDHALAQANSAFSLVQEYNQHLEAENRNLKNRLNSAEIAERSRSSNDPGSKTVIPTALFNLLKPNN